MNKGLKIVLYVVIAIVVVGFITSKIGSDFAVEKQVTINKSKAVVFNYVKYLKNQDNFSSWAKKDPAMKKEYKGEDGTVGFVASWDSEDKEVGRGEQEIKKITPDDRIDFELRFFEPFESTDNAYITTEGQENNSTLVKWGFDSNISLFKKIMFVVMSVEEKLGNQLQEGLDNLKIEVEKLSEQPVIAEGEEGDKTEVAGAAEGEAKKEKTKTE